MRKIMETLKTVWANTNRWIKGILIFFIIELQVLPKNQVGFSCKDPALSHPFTGDTITWKHLLGVVSLLPLAVMLVVEVTYHRDKTIKPRKQALRWYREYMFGVLVNLTVVQFIKQIVGSPRPHFFDTCSPHEASSCNDSEYVPYYSCTKAHWLTQSDRSFPSGHMSLALHAGFFLTYYLYKRARRSKVTLIIQAVLVAVAVYCGISRMTDHRHHWWDVLGGAIIGVPILLYTILYLCRNFEAPHEEVKSFQIDSNNLDKSDAQLVESK